MFGYPFYLNVSDDSIATTDGSIKSIRVTLSNTPCQVITKIFELRTNDPFAVVEEIPNKLIDNIVQIELSSIRTSKTSIRRVIEVMASSSINDQAFTKVSVEFI